MNFQVDQKTRDVLDLIRGYIGGNIGYRRSQDAYCYGSIGFGPAKKVIEYFDVYPLLSHKHVNYLQ